MSIDNYGLGSEQYKEFFRKNVQLSAELYLETCKILNETGAGALDFKTILDLYQEAVYSTNDDCRRYQKNNNPDALKDNDLYVGLGPTREELLEEVQSVNSKVEALTDYISELVRLTSSGLTHLSD
jgi:hypothetical protein